ncbi:HAD hydrolase-like protein [Dyella telluris]|uniref:phosphoglycolate phosphatase n=1 Tax=Dyella telluris TaxID=2763498 RepID=A0A7G8Q351_9GAMM|nr:HAD hydrolase-like protein [Dyella telluris]QNK01209.1 HAD hydrolase-like protein [Dyella telluris]
MAIFDLDGTLVDSVDGIALAINRRLHGRGIAPLQRDEAIPLLGDGLAAFARRAYALRQTSPVAGDIEAFVQDCLTHAEAGAQLYPGARDTLDLLVRDGWQLAVCTNKIETAAIAMLGHLEVLDLFAAVCGGDTVERQKPDPCHIHQTLHRAGLHDVPAVMIGDNVVDLAAARSYGIPGIFADWGYGQLPHDVAMPSVARHFTELPQRLAAALSCKAI